MQIYDKIIKVNNQEVNGDYNKVIELIQEKGIYVHATSNINIHTPNAVNLVSIKQNKFSN